MHISEIIEKRRSIRAFLQTPVSDELIRRCVESARWAPSPRNCQPWRFIVVRDPFKKQRFDPYHNQPWIIKAPVVLVCCADLTELNRKVDESLHNTYVSALSLGAAIQNILLTATEQGLGSVLIAAFSAKKIRELCKIPLHISVVSLICLGYYRDEDGIEYGGEQRKNNTIPPRLACDKILFNEILGTPLPQSEQPLE